MGRKKDRHMHTDIHIYIRTYAHTFIRCIHTLHSYVTYMHACMHTYHAYMFAILHVCMYTVYTCKNNFVHIHAYITYTHTHIYIYVCVCNKIGLHCPGSCSAFPGVITSTFQILFHPCDCAHSAHGVQRAHTVINVCSVRFSLSLFLCVFVPCVCFCRWRFFHAVKERVRHVHCGLGCLFCIEFIVIASHFFFRWLCCLRNGYNFYHQYAQLDFTVLDKRLGTLDELRHLVADAHELGIYVIVDVVQS